MDYEDHKSSDTDDRVGSFPSSPSPSAVIEELNYKLLKLEEWKKEIGIPALKEVETLKVDIMEHENIQITLNQDILSLKQENQNLQLQIDEYEHEHYKLSTDRTELLSTLGELELEASISKKEEEHWAKSVEEQYHKIDKLNKQRRRSHSDLQIQQRTISELLEENSTLKSKIDEMTLLNDKNRQTIAHLNEKLKDLNIEHNDLLKKHQELGLELLTVKDKASNIYIGQYIAQQLNGSEGSLSLKNGSHGSPNSINGAIPVLFNPKTLSTHGSAHGSTHGSTKELLTGIGHGSNGSHQSLQIDKLSNASMSPKFEFIRRRSHSFDSEKSNDRLIMHHMEDFDEKEAFDLNQHDLPFDEDKLRHEIQLDLKRDFEREKCEMNDKYDTLQRKYDQLKSKYDRERNPRNRSFIIDSNDSEGDSSDNQEMNDNPVRNRHDLMAIRSREEQRKMKQQKDKEKCWMIFPWNCK